MVNKIKVLGWILQAPLILLGIASFFLSIYVYIYMQDIYSVPISTPIITGIIIFSFIIGLILVNSKKFNSN